MNTMARHDDDKEDPGEPEEDTQQTLSESVTGQGEEGPSEQGTTVKAVDGSNPDPRESRFAGYGASDIPDGVIALREYSEGGRFYITITDIVRELDYRAGEDYLYVQFEQGNGNKPSALRLEHVPEPTKNDESNSRVRKIIDNGTTARLTLPKVVFGEYGIDLELENYDEADPFLFEPILLDTNQEFYLNPLGHVTEVFEYNDEITSPVSPNIVDDVAADAGVDAAEVQEKLDVVARTLSDRTFEAAGLPLLDTTPEVVSVDGQRLAINYGPNPGNHSVFVELLAGLYGFPAVLAEACRKAHQQQAHSLLREVHGELPSDHLLRDDDTEAIIIPLDPEGEEGSADGMVSRERVPPVQPSFINSTDVDKKELLATLSELAEPNATDSIEREFDQVRPAVKLPFESAHEAPADFSEVAIFFVPPGEYVEYLDESGVDQELAEGCQEAYNRQARQLIRKVKGTPGSYRQFHRDSDAVIVPITGD